MSALSKFRQFSSHALHKCAKLRHLVLASVLVIAGCTHQRELSHASSSFVDYSVERIFVATTRKPTKDLQTPFSADRHIKTSYADFSVTIPPNHKPGRIEWPNKNANPSRHFTISTQNHHSSESEFLRHVNQSLNPENSSVTVFVHGYNTDFAEGLYRLAQMRHDYDSPGLALHYSWPSAGDPRAYIYDRDSIVHSRDGLADFLKLISKSQAKKIYLTAHSIGSLLTIEALRQVSIEGDGSLNGKLSGIVLMSPDLDQEVFIGQLSKLDHKPEQFVVFTSKKDRALKISSILSGGGSRVGSTPDYKTLKSLGITLIDVSQFTDGDRLNHMTVGSSPTAISLIRGLNDITDTPRLLRATSTAY